jgi:hypothetical protein
MTPSRIGPDEILIARLELSAIPGPDPRVVDATWRRMVAEGTPLIERARAWMARTGQTVRQVVADLAHEGTAVPAEALRGSSTATPRMLVYETDVVTISLQLEHDGDRVSLRGQLIPHTDREPFEGARAEVRGGDELWGTDLTEFGEFELRGLPRGPIDLVLGFDDQVIRLSPLPEV